MMQFDSLAQFLQWLTVSGGGGVALAFFLERQPEFQRLSSRTKFWLVAGLCVVIPVLASVAQGGVDANSLFLAVQAGVVAFASSQWAHKQDIWVQ